MHTTMGGKDNGTLRSDADAPTRRANVQAKLSHSSEQQTGQAADTTPFVVSAYANANATANASATADLAKSKSASTAGAMLIWDLPVRLFHWALVSAVMVAAITGFLAPEWWLDVHSWAGYTIGFLVIFRVLWGLWGTFYARFRSFIFPVDETLAHLRALVQKKPGHYRGHNPAGALMVFTLLGTLIALTVSGLIILGGQENIGVLAGYVSFATGSGAVEFHEILAFGLLGLIGAHLVGVLIESLLSRENLVRAMVTGRKSLSPSPAQPSVGYTQTSALEQRELPSTKRVLARAIATVIIVFLAGSGAAWALLKTPPNGYVAMPANKTYASECGDCHQAYHPSLLPGSSWNKLMAGLGDHFGEDASLDDESAKEVYAFLRRYASDKWDSEAANNLRQVATRNPITITATPYWQRRHKDIDKSVFAQKKIGTKGNCIACHKDAMSGHFDDANIAIPQPVMKNKNLKVSKHSPGMAVQRAGLQSGARPGADGPMVGRTNSVGKE